MRIAIVVSHPIQHFCPMYASWAENKSVTLRIFFASNIGAQKYVDKEFGREVEWGALYLDKFDHVFLNGFKPIPINPELDAQNVFEHLEKFQPDLIILYGRIYKFNKRAKEWSISNGVKLAYVSDSELRHYENLLYRLLKGLFMPYFFKRFDFFLSVGDANEEFYLRHGVSPLKIIRMNFSIDLKLYEFAFYQRDALRFQLRSGLGISECDIVISVIGKLLDFKRQADLIDLVKMIFKKVKGVRVYLLIVGSGPMESFLLEKAGALTSKFIHFLGFLQPHDLPRIYASTDIYIQPSSIDRHSLSVSEAIYMGLPVIVTNTSGSYGNSDDVQPGINGFVYKVGDVEDLFQYVFKLFDSDLRARFSSCSVQISRASQHRAHVGVLQELISRIKSSK